MSAMDQEESREIRLTRARANLRLAIVRLACARRYTAHNPSVLSTEQHSAASGDAIASLRHDDTVEEETSTSEDVEEVAPSTAGDDGEETGHD